MNVDAPGHQRIRPDVKPLFTIDEEVLDKPEFSNFVNRSDFKILSIIGRGSFGTVNLCEFDNQTFALKVIKKDKVDKDALERELNVLRYLKDDTICQESLLCFRGYDETSNSFYILTDYVDNSYKPLNYEGDFDADLFKNIYKAITNLHNHGVAHLDIKPENILCNSQTKQVKIIDFGGSCTGITENSIVKCPDKTNITKTEKYFDLRLARILINPPPVVEFKIFQNADEWSFCVIVCNAILGRNLFDYHNELITNGINGSQFALENWFYANVYLKQRIHIFNHFEERLNESVRKVNEALQKAKIDKTVEDFFAPYPDALKKGGKRKSKLIKKRTGKKRGHRKMISKRRRITR